MTEPSRDWRTYYQDVPSRAPLSAFRGRRYGWIVAAVVVIVVIVVVALVGWRVAASWLRPPEDPEDAAAPPVSVALGVPDRIGDRTKNVDENMTKAASDDIAWIGAVAGIIDVQAAFYGTDKGKNLIYVVAMRSSSLSNREVLDDLIKVNLQTDGSEITHSEAVQAGPLGGWARCGEFRLYGERRVFCAWVDGGSRGLVIWYYTPLDKARQQFSEIRGSVVRVA